MPGAPAWVSFPEPRVSAPAGRRKHESEYGGRNVQNQSYRSTDDRRLRTKGEVMPLTPEDVSNKRFTPVRLREGYDMGEVDQFLDEVEAELARLTKENDDLRSKLSAAQGGAPAVTERAPEPPKVEEKAPEPTPEPTPAPAAPAPMVSATPVETLRVETVPQASNAAARL